VILKVQQQFKPSKASHFEMWDRPESITHRIENANTINKLIQFHMEIAHTFYHQLFSSPEIPPGCLGLARKYIATAVLHFPITQHITET